MNLLVVIRPRNIRRQSFGRQFTRCVFTNQLGNSDSTQLSRDRPEMQFEFVSLDLVQLTFSVIVYQLTLHHQDLFPESRVSEKLLFEVLSFSFFQIAEQEAPNPDFILNCF